MADMTQDDHIKAIEKYRDGILSGGVSVPYDDLMNALDAAIAALRCRETCTQSGTWVRTEEKVPEKGQWFIPIVNLGDDWGTGLIMLAGEDVAQYLENYNWKYWFPVPPLPPLPEVEP